MKSSGAVVIFMFLLGCVSACSSGGTSSTCELDRDCGGADFFCDQGVCRQRSSGEDGGIAEDSRPVETTTDGEPGGNQDSDQAVDQSGDRGGDNGTDNSQSWIIQPGVGIGPLNASGSTSQTGFTLEQVRGVLGESGTATALPTSLSFKDGDLIVSGYDTSGKNGFDNPDRVLSLTATKSLQAATSEGIKLGSKRADVIALTGYTAPDYSWKDIPLADPPGQIIDEYFKKGIWITYDPSGLATAIVVTRPYTQPPSGTLVFEDSPSLTFGSKKVVFGDGYITGGKKSDHRAILGEPDWNFTFTSDVPVGANHYVVEFYVDAYRNLGLELLGGNGTQLNIGVLITVDRLLAATLYAPYFGKTADGLGVGSTRQAWEAKLGTPIKELIDKTSGVKTYVYSAGSKKIAIQYVSNSSAPSTQYAAVLVINYQETQ